MKITVYETKATDINLDRRQMKEVTLAYLMSFVRPGEYLRTDHNGKLVLKMDDPYHRHGSISEEYVRDATELDIAVFDIIGRLRGVE
jgi:hypothetical protein